MKVDYNLLPCSGNKDETCIFVESDTTVYYCNEKVPYYLPLGYG